MRIAILVCSLVAVLPACGGGDCTTKAERKLNCPDGYVGYGRRTPNRNKDWLPVFSLEDLSLWASDGTYKTSGSCEQACVPQSLGEPTQFQVCDEMNLCGGNLLGDWRWDTYACPYEVPTTMDAVCTDGTQTHAASTDGTITFEQDGTVRFTGTEVYNIDTGHIPTTCTETLEDCKDLNSNDATCAGDPTTGCTCTGEYQTVGTNWEGTYKVVGATSIEFDIDGVKTVADYCAEGERLILLWEEDDQGVRVREHLFKFNN